MADLLGKIARLQRGYGFDATVTLVCGPRWVHVEQMVGAIGRVTPAGATTLDAALDDLIAQVEHKDAHGITRSGRIAVLPC